MNKLVLWGGVGLGVVVLGLAGFLASRAMAWDASVATVWDVAPPPVERSTDPVVLARGKHLAESIGGCTACHGADLGGGPTEAMGPVGSFTGPNLTRGAGGVGEHYDAGTMARAVAHGVKADGTTVRFMPSMDLAWWPRDDLEAVASYVLSVPPVDREVPESEVGLLGKVLDRQDAFPLDIARRIDHDAPRPDRLAPTPTKEYGARLGLLCMGCHGKGLSGGAMQGVPDGTPPASNLTPHETGLADWSEADFRRLLDEGIKPDGSALHPFMPVASFGAMDDVEKRALWAYLQSLPPKEFGGF